MITDTERNEVWEAMLEADYQKRYWNANAAAFIQVDRRLQILLAVLSSAAVLSAFDDLNLLGLWKLLSTITAIVATTLPFMNYTRRSVAMTEIAAKWHHLEIEYSSIWRSLDKDIFDESKFKELRAQEVEIGKAISDFPIHDKKLQHDCYRQVLISRGIQDDMVGH